MYIYICLIFLHKNNVLSFKKAFVHGDHDSVHCVSEIKETDS